MYEMLTGELPFKSEYEQAVVYAILNEQPRSVSSSRKDVPAELDKVVARCLEKEPSKRYQNCNEVLADLHRLKGIPITLGLGWGLAKQKLRSHTLGVAAIAAVIFSVIGYFLFDPFGGPPEPSVQSLAVVYFENLPDPEDKDHMGAVLANLLITSLSQVRELDVTSREKLYHIQRYLTQSDEKTITPSLATQIAQQAGVQWMLLGTILQKEPNLVVNSRLVDVKSGRIVSSQKASRDATRQAFHVSR